MRVEVSLVITWSLRFICTENRFRFLWKLNQNWLIACDTMMTNRVQKESHWLITVQYGQVITEKKQETWTPASIQTHNNTLYCSCLIWFWPVASLFEVLHAESNPNYGFLSHVKIEPCVLWDSSHRKVSESINKCFISTPDLFVVPSVTYFNLATCHVDLLSIGKVSSAAMCAVPLGS